MREFAQRKSIMKVEKPRLSGTRPMLTLQSKCHVITIDLPDGWTFQQPGFFRRFFGTVVNFENPDQTISANIIAGSSRGYDTLQQHEQLFRSLYPASSIVAMSSITVGGTAHFAAIYRKTGMIHKRYAIIHDGMEYAVVCSSLLPNEDEFIQNGVAICDQIVGSMQFK
jgi:hypothetical protein